jgi:hypothetical protein
MKQITLVLFTALITLISYGQHKKDLVISVAAGALTSPYYLENKGAVFILLTLIITYQKGNCFR